MQTYGREDERRPWQARLTLSLSFSPSLTPSLSPSLRACCLCSSLTDESKLCCVQRGAAQIWLADEFSWRWATSVSTSPHHCHPCRSFSPASSSSPRGTAFGGFKFTLLHPDEFELKRSRRHFSPARRSSARSPNAFNSHAVVNTSHHFTSVLKMKYLFFSESNQFPYFVSAHKVGKPSGNYSNLVLRWMSLLIICWSEIKMRVWLLAQPVIHRILEKINNSHLCHGNENNKNTIENIFVCEMIKMFPELPYIFFFAQYSLFLEIRACRNVDRSRWKLLTEACVFFFYLWDVSASVNEPR